MVFIYLKSESLFAQVSVYNQQPLIEIIKDIESKSDHVFNYDPESLDENLLSISIDYSNFRESIQSLFDLTNHEYTLSDNAILILPPQLSNYRFCGYLYDSLSLEPLIGANIYIADTIGTISDIQGFFEYNFKAYKNDVIKISYLGYEDIDLPMLRIKQDDCLIMHMRSKIFTEGEILIKDYITRGITEGKYYSETSLNTRVLHQEISIPQNDLLTTLQYLPGLQSIDESAANLNIRGSTPDQNLILWEGANLYNPGHLQGMVSIVNPFTIETTQVYKSAHNAKYENRVGGIVDIKLPDNISNGMNGSIGFNSTEFHGNLQYGVGEKLQLYIGGRSSLNNLIEGSPTIQNFGAKIFQVENPDSINIENEERENEFEIDFNDINAKIIYRPNERLSITSSYLSASDNIEFKNALSSNELEIEELNETNTDISVSKLSYKWNHIHTSSLSYIISDYFGSAISSIKRSGTEISDLDISSSNNIRDRQFTIHHNISHDYFNYNFGYTFDRKKLDYNFSKKSNFEESFDDTYSANSRFHHVYGSIQFNNDRIKSDLGLRTSYFQNSGQLHLLPRLSFQYLVFENLKFKVNSGYFNQFISKLNNLTESGLVASESPWILIDGNEYRSLNSLKLSGGLIYQNRDLLIDLDLYSHTSTGLLTQNNTSTGFIEINDMGKSRVTGMDLLLKKSWGPYLTWAKYTLSRQTLKFDIIEEGDIPSNIDQRHVLSWINQIQMGDFTFGITHHFKSGQPYSLSVGLSETDIEENEDPVFEIELEGINTRRVPPYHRTDLNLRYSKSILKNELSIEVQLGLLNLFNVRNISSRSTVIASAADSNDIPELVDIERVLLRRTPHFMLRLYW